MTIRSILLLEDDPSLIRLLEINLRASGFNTVEARTVGEAWKQVQEVEYDGAIVDLHLPGVHGWEFIERIRRDREREGLPILITSGDLREEDLQKSVDMRCEVLEKPYDPDELVRRVIAMISTGLRVQVRSRPARVILDDLAIEGNLHLPLQSNRFSDGIETLMADERSLLPMTAVRALRLDGSVLYETTFAQIAKAHIRAVTILEDD